VAAPGSGGFAQNYVNYISNVTVSVRSWM
jgi:hypothetical protein